jgi:hypothetical protein
LTADIKPGEMIGGLVAGDRGGYFYRCPDAARPSTSAISAKSYITRNPATNPCRYHARV